MGINFTNQKNKNDTEYKELSFGYGEFLRTRNAIAYSINKDFGDFYTSFFETMHDPMSVLKIEQNLRCDQSIKRVFFDSDEYDKWPGETFENVCGDYDFENQFSRYIIDLAFEKENERKKKFEEDYNKKINDEKFMEQLGVDMDIVDFMYSPDCSGKCSWKTCGKIYEKIKNDRKIRADFRGILKHCFKNKRNLKWY